MGSQWVQGLYGTVAEVQNLLGVHRLLRLLWKQQSRRIGEKWERNYRSIRLCTGISGAILRDVHLYSGIILSQTHALIVPGTLASLCGCGGVDVVNMDNLLLFDKE